MLTELQLAGDTTVDHGEQQWFDMVIRYELIGSLSKSKTDLKVMDHFVMMLLIEHNKLMAMCQAATTNCLLI